MNDINLPILLAEFLLKSAIIVALGFVMMAIMKKASPAARHNLWFQVFLGSLLIPLLLIAIPRWQIIPAPEQPLQQAAAITNSASEFTPAIPGESIAIKSRPSTPDKSLSLADWLSIAWLIGVILFSLQSVVGLALLKGINRRANRPSDDCQQVFENIRKSVACNLTPKLLISSDIETPFTWGIFKPTILLPSKADQWSRQDLEMILLHELSHIQRHDAIAVFVSRLFLSLNWVNPFAWLAIRESAEVREADCDLKVLRHGHSAQSYAEMLFNQAKISSTHPARHCATAVAENGTIEQRIKMILNTKSKYSSKMIYTKTATAILVASIFIIGITGKADDKEKKAQTNPIAVKLKNIRIPSLQLQDTPLEDAINFLHQKSIELDTATPNKQSKGINLVIAPGVARETPITMRLTNVPFGEALRYITALAGANYRVDVHAVVIENKANQAATASPNPADEMEIASNQKKLDTLLMPSLEYHDTPLLDALQFIQQKSVELDTGEANREKRGFNLIFDAGENFNAKEKKITLKLKNASLATALKYTCELSGCRYLVESHAVIIKPKIK